jgi:hypothetical protein
MVETALCSMKVGTIISNHALIIRPWCVSVLPCRAMGWRHVLCIGSAWAVEWDGWMGLGQGWMNSYGWMNGWMIVWVPLLGMIIECMDGPTPSNHPSAPFVQSYPPPLNPYTPIHPSTPPNHINTLAPSSTHPISANMSQGNSEQRMGSNSSGMARHWVGGWQNALEWWPMDAWVDGQAASLAKRIET